LSDLAVRRRGARTREPFNLTMRTNDAIETAQAFRSL
jgi:hypothetical protein